MPKKSNFRNENRGQGGHNAERQERAGKWKEEKVHGRPDQPGNPNENRQPIQENYQQPVQQPFQQAQPGSNPGGLAYYRRLLQARRERMQGNRQAQGDVAKRGCLPKLFMLALPFVFVSTFLILGL